MDLFLHKKQMHLLLLLLGNHATRLLTPFMSCFTQIHGFLAFQLLKMLISKYGC
jgi:hypothetical protein